MLNFKALSIPRQRDAKLNELPKQIFMLLPLLLLLLLLLYVLYHVLIRGREAPPKHTRPLRRLIGSLYI